MGRLHALLHLRQLRRYERQQRERIWAEDETQPKAADMQVGVLGLGALGADAATKLRALGFRVAGWSATPKRIEGVDCFYGRRRPDAAAGANRHARRAAAADATRRAACSNAALSRQLEAGGAARRPGADQRRTRRPAGRGGHRRGAGFRRPEGRIARRVRARAAAGGIAALVAPRRLCQSAQRRDLRRPGAIVAAIARQIEAYERGEPLANVVDRARGY